MYTVYPDLNKLLFQFPDPVRGLILVPNTIKNPILKPVPALAQKSGFISNPNPVPNLVSVLNWDTIQKKIPNPDLTLNPAPIPTQLWFYLRIQVLVSSPAIIINRFESESDYKSGSDFETGSEICLQMRFRILILIRF
jgi:hypothetical protein